MILIFIVFLVNKFYKFKNGFLKKLKYKYIFTSIFIVTTVVGYHKYWNSIRCIYLTKFSRVDYVNFLKAVFHKIYLVHSQILCPSR